MTFQPGENSYSTCPKTDADWVFRRKVLTRSIPVVVAPKTLEKMLYAGARKPFDDLASTSR